MASKVDGQQLKDLVCPLCLDVFKNPTLLSCGHTFCRECLEAYDEQHHLDQLVCPVCRETTNLGENRVDGLASNFLARDMQDKLHIVVPSQSFCPLHTNVHNDIFCEDCTQWICLTCFIESHKDHKIKKKEELDVHLRKKRDSLIHKSEMRKAQIEKYVKNAEKHRTDTHSHYSRIEKEIKDEFAKRVTILQQKEESLLNKLDSSTKKTENQFVGCIADQSQAIDDINISIAILRGYTGENVGSDSMKTQYLQFIELEKSLETRIPVDETSTIRLKQIADSTRFRPSDEKLLAIGHIEEDVKERTTATAVERKSEQPPAARKKVAVIPSPVRSKSTACLNIKVGSGGIGVPDIKQQKQQISELLETKMRKGDSWYLIDSKWFKQWKKFVGYESWDVKNMGNDASNPGPVDNSGLFVEGDAGNLKEYLIEELDYDLVPANAWEKLIAWYGIVKDQPPVKRKVVEYGLFVKHCKVEVYLMELKLCENNNLDEMVPQKFSKADTIETIEKEMKRLFEIEDEEETRIWKNDMSNTYEQLNREENTAQDEGLYQGMVLVIEQKNQDGTWPRQPANNN